MGAMRAPLVLLALVLVSGCAEQDASPTSPTSSTPTPPVTREPTPTATPIPTPTPTLPVGDGTPYRETRGEWTLVVEPGVISGLPGDAVDVRFTIEGPRGARGRLGVDEGWMDPARGSVPMEDGRATLLGTVYVRGNARLSTHVSLTEADPWTVVVFDGPPTRLEGVQEDLPVARYTDVSDHAPALSVQVEGDDVRVVFAARENATSTGDEAVSADGPMLLARGEDGTRLVLFVTRVFNDAIMYFDEPQRTRVESLAQDLPPGEVRVIVVTTVSCFCAEFDPPVVHEQRVVVAG